MILLENVLGISDYLPDVLAILEEALPTYQIEYRILDPILASNSSLQDLALRFLTDHWSRFTFDLLRADYGSNTSRKRYYFFLVQRRWTLSGNFANHIDLTLAEIKNWGQKNSIPWFEAYFGSGVAMYQRPCC